MTNGNGDEPKRTKSGRKTRARPDRPDDAGERGPVKGEGGGPRKDLFTDEQLGMLERWASIGATQEEMSALLGIDADTLRARIADTPSVGDRIKRGAANLKVSLRRRQTMMALGSDAAYDEKGNLIRPYVEPSTTMLIWCGKTILGQSDRLNVKIESPGDAISILRDIFPDVDEDTIREIRGVGVDPTKLM